MYKQSARKVFLFVKTIALILLLAGCAQNEPFKIVLLPDTQMYSEKFPEIFRAQTAWIAENADSFAFVLHQGDITNRNSVEQWENAVSALKLLEDKIPFTFVAGNHDLGINGSANNRESDLLNKYLPYSRFSKKEGFGGAYEEGKMDNTWHTFKAGGLDWLILSLEFGPRNKVLEWAGTVISEHPSHNVIINTHAYMFTDNTRMNHKKEHSWVPQNYGVGKATGEDAANDGEMMWEKLVGAHPNVLMVVSGHVLNSGVGTQVSTGTNGNKVYQMLANYQMKQKGGNGYLRILTIDPKNRKISVKTYSPYLDEYNADPDQQFEFEEVTFNR